MSHAGVIRDLTGSYVFCIIFINIVTAITLVMWTIEFLIKRMKSRRKLNHIAEPGQDNKNLESR